MSDYKTLGEAFRVFTEHVSNNIHNAKHNSEVYLALAGHYHKLSDDVLEDAADMDDLQYQVAIEQFVMLRSMYNHNRLNAVSVLDTMLRVYDAKQQLNLVLISIKELR